MTSLQERIEKNIFKTKEKSGLAVFHEIAYVLNKEFGWTYEDVSEAPIPYVFWIMNIFEEQLKKERATMKKRSR